jgi:hypothetical protein
MKTKKSMGAVSGAMIDAANRYPATPELDKMKEAQPISQHLSGFLDWLDEKGYTIAEKCGDYLAQRRGSKEELLAAFFGIDLKKVEQERRAILDAIRKKS